MLARNTIVSCGIFAFDIALLWGWSSKAGWQGRGDRARLRHRQFDPICIRARLGLSRTERAAAAGYVYS